jgi:uncharacterized Zn-binding protein involved in type VI secretion
MTFLQAQASVSTLSVNVNANISACGPQSSNPTHASTVMEAGKVKFENDNYRITAGDNDDVTIFDKHTGETTNVAGDPHVAINGKHAFDFWGTTTFALKDGTKVTIETTPYAKNPAATLSSKVTITNGEYGVQITGVDSNKHGDLKFEEGKGWGKAIDAVVDDGNIIYAKQGGGYEGVDNAGHVRNVDQNFINETDLTKGGAFKAHMGGFFDKLSSLLSIALSGLYRSNQGSNDAGEGASHAHHHHHHHNHQFPGDLKTLPYFPAPVSAHPATPVNLHAELTVTQVSLTLHRASALA